MGLVFSISNFFINKIALANIWMSFSCSNLALDCATDKYCLKKLSWNCPKVFHKIVPKIVHEIVPKLSMKLSPKLSTKLTWHPSFNAVNTLSVNIPPQPLKPIKTLGWTFLTTYDNWLFLSIYSRVSLKFLRLNASYWNGWK